MGRKTREGSFGGIKSKIKNEKKKFNFKRLQKNVRVKNLKFFKKKVEVFRKFYIYQKSSEIV